MSQRYAQVYEFLRNECQRLKINPYNYCIGDQQRFGEGEYVFEGEGDLWVVYGYERGKVKNRATFENLYDAITFFIYRLTITPSNRKMPKITFQAL